MQAETIAVGRWHADRNQGRLRNGGECRDVEPKVMDLLFVLAAHPNQVVSREELTAALWPDTTVGEDALARCVFKLRRALDDDPRAPRYIETIPKRGYRLLRPDEPAAEPLPAPRRSRGAVAPIWPAAGALILAGVAVLALAPQRDSPRPTDPLLARADDNYFQYTPSDNEAAIRLYERALAGDPRSAPALAGLSSALVQKILRWQDGKPLPAGVSALRVALASGRLARADAVAALARSLALARQAASISPGEPAILRALGLALSASGRLDEAAAVYDKGLAIAPDDWGLLINRADLYDIAGQSGAALPLLERAYASMARGYAQDPAKIRPWQARLGVEIGRRYEARSRRTDALRWYQRSLSDDPSSQQAADRLAALSAK